MFRLCAVLCESFYFLRFPPPSPLPFSHFLSLFSLLSLIDCLFLIFSPSFLTSPPPHPSPPSLPLLPSLLPFLCVIERGGWASCFILLHSDHFSSLSHLGQPVALPAGQQTPAHTHFHSIFNWTARSSASLSGF